MIATEKTLAPQPDATLTHFDSSGSAHMVDVGDKSPTKRLAIAEGTLLMRPETLSIIMSHETKKGDVLGVARIAAIMATKRTSDLIPLCHPLELTRISVEFKPNESKTCIICNVEVESYSKTGVEMEALTAVQIALLTIYDMCKAIERGMIITNVRLLRKSGGKSGEWTADII